MADSKTGAGKKSSGLVDWSKAQWGKVTGSKLGKRLSEFKSSHPKTAKWAGRGARYGLVGAGAAAAGAYYQGKLKKKFKVKRLKGGKRRYKGK